MPKQMHSDQVDRIAEARMRRMQQAGMRTTAEEARKMTEDSLRRIEKHDADRPPKPSKEK